MTSPYEKRLLRVIDHIHANTGGDLSLDALADVAAMSRFHWHRIFRAMTGETVAEAVRRIRMNRAGFWLLDGEPVAKVAVRVGYPTARSFTRAFAEVHGLTPSAFRRTGLAARPAGLVRKGYDMTYAIDIRNEPPRRLFGVEHRGPYMEIARSFEKLSAVMTGRNLWEQARGMVGVYYDDPKSVKPAALRSHAAVAVAPGAAKPDGLDEIALPGGPTAVLRFKGHYAGLPAAYDWLYGSWLPASGREAGDSPPFEVYVNSPMDTAPEDLLTDISVPLR